MLSFTRNLLFNIRRPAKLLIALVIVLSSAASSCSYYYFPDRINSIIHKPDTQLKSIKYIVIESLTGRDATRLLPILEELISLNGTHIILNQPDPELLESTALLRAEVEEVIFYESQISESSQNLGNPFESEDGTSYLLDLSSGDNAIRVNSAININFEMRRASDNRPLYKHMKGRAFQQVYHTIDGIADRPDASLETDRLARLIFTSYANSIDPVTPLESFFFETGRPPELDWRENLGFETSALMVKGLRYALAEEWELALLTWLVVAFEPTPQDSPTTFMHNRASAFFNMGQVLRLNKAWDLAALMYAEANLSVARLHYAQYWSDMIIQNKLAARAEEEAANRSPDEIQGDPNSSLSGEYGSEPIEESLEADKELEESRTLSLNFKKKLYYSLKSNLPNNFEGKVNRSLILDEKSLYTDVNEL